MAWVCGLCYVPLAKWTNFVGTQFAQLWNTNNSNCPSRGIVKKIVNESVSTQNAWQSTRMHLSVYLFTHQTCNEPLLGTVRVQVPCITPWTEKTCITPTCEEHGSNGKHGCNLKLEAQEGPVVFMWLVRRKTIKAEDVVQLVGHLPSRHKALGSIPTITKKQEWCILEIPALWREVEN